MPKIDPMFVPTWKDDVKTADLSYSTPDRSMIDSKMINKIKSMIKSEKWSYMKYGTCPVFLSHGLEFTHNKVRFWVDINKRDDDTFRATITPLP